MYLHEDMVVMIVQERIEDARRYAEHRRALRSLGRRAFRQESAWAWP